jgi:hypothetical protein
VAQFDHERGVETRADERRLRDDRIARLRADLQELVGIVFGMQDFLLSITGTTDHQEAYGRLFALREAFQRVRVRLLLDGVGSQLAKATAMVVNRGGGHYQALLTYYETLKQAPEVAAKNMDRLKAQGDELHDDLTALVETCRDELERVSQPM